MLGRSKVFWFLLLVSTGIACLSALYLNPLTDWTFGRKSKLVLDSIFVLPNAYDMSIGAQNVFYAWEKIYSVDLSKAEVVQRYEQTFTQDGWQVTKQTYSPAEGADVVCLRADRWLTTVYVDVLEITNSGKPSIDTSKVIISIPPNPSFCEGS